MTLSKVSTTNFIGDDISLFSQQVQGSTLSALFNIILEMRQFVTGAHFIANGFHITIKSLLWDDDDDLNEQIRRRAKIKAIKSVIVKNSVR